VIWRTGLPPPSRTPSPRRHPSRQVLVSAISPGRPTRCLRITGSCPCSGTPGRAENYRLHWAGPARPNHRTQNSCLSPYRASSEWSQDHEQDRLRTAVFVPRRSKRVSLCLLQVSVTRANSRHRAVDLRRRVAWRGVTPHQAPRRSPRRRDFARPPPLHGAGAASSYMRRSVAVDVRSARPVDVTCPLMAVVLVAVAETTVVSHAPTGAPACNSKGSDRQHPARVLTEGLAEVLWDRVVRPPSSSPGRCSTEPDRV